MPFINCHRRRCLSIAVLLLLLLRQSQVYGIDFHQDVAPILENRCWYCHGEEEQESGLRLDRRASMLNGGDSGLAAVVPGKPEKSHLIELITHPDEDMKMPKDDERLTVEEIEILTRWIKKGAIWPGQMRADEREKSDHWSFQPVLRPDVPSVATGSSNPIDAFLLQSLAKHGLSFSEPADPRALLRRVSIVLTGLVPTSEEITEFLDAYAKDSDKAYAALVDRLLDSPHFGERWAQHWLDVIRWAESNGSESNLYRKNAWVFRDYVIQAFNDDKPYDQFVFEQIAGDTVGQGEATGYLVSGPHVPAATVGREPSARRQARADRMDEILQTIGASALGVTIGCARCHNHKFDPISIRDYYSMAAVFQDIEFGSRFPEIGDDDPRRVRGKELNGKIAKLRRKIQELGSWEENWTGYKELHFPAIDAKAVRITFTGDILSLDELEIIDAQDWRKNWALDLVGTEADCPPSIIDPTFPFRRINDGHYGTDSWNAKIPDNSELEPWVRFTFKEPHQVNRIRLSTNREDFFETDYLSGLSEFKFDNYRVEVQEASGEWRQVVSTSDFEQLNEKNPTRADLLERLQKLIHQIYEEGPKSSFVGRFIKPVKTHIFGRGSPENPRDEVFPAGLEELDGDLKVKPYAPGNQRRKAFAEWLTDSTHPLTARVAVNRLWHHVFGRGIVSTISDVGIAGARPTHPELLDWLAAELVQPSNSSDSTVPVPWSMKHLIRLMVMSKAFRQSSLPREAGLKLDADAALLWRFPPKRVEAEVIRDSILQASGSLDLSIGGRSYRIHNVKERYAQWEVSDNHGRRTWLRMIYQERMRRVDDHMFIAFDFPDCGQIQSKRPVSTTPLQALNLMNSEFVIEQSKLIAARATSDAGGNETKSINRCFELLLGRAPNSQETQACLELAQDYDLSLVCRALINSNGFAFLP